MGKTSRNIFLILVKAAGYCCADMFWRSNSHIRTGIIAKRLGLETRTIRLHRAAFKARSPARCALCCKGPDKMPPLVDVSDDTYAPPGHLSPP